ncbi:MAG: N-acetylmuramoyl-L-alanine amidase [Ardenticatenaceae bacterium]|nr:N-acetylmuramoyl-L-alanine amidase [Anaerolineales bacterium]MCB8921483.1 N-acetylmuramoyl-L-alanine amidase [Ardenticatenaceae bacterium]MCB8990890.1 N-acetylmuramoyl-L-alanine amidase [Ardenticatenaceae bacterium]MCB9004957.1 N-acetylmuramoyl-L-alanine amidase [Ardenticatenaceae bacterium]
MKFKSVTFAGLIILLLVLVRWPAEVGAEQTAVAGLADLAFSANEFVQGTGEGFQVVDAGLMVADTAVTAVYTSPVVQSPIPFNVIVPKWTAVIPDGASLEIQVRSKTAVGDWTDWADIHENDDWMTDADSPTVGSLFLTPNAFAPHQLAQYRVSMGRYEGTESPILQTLTLTFIDTSNTPTTEELLAEQQAWDAGQNILPANTTSFPKPSVISRQVWCNPYYGDECNPAVTYYPVSHLIVHHTVTNNSYTPSESAAIVRAIWRYHNYTNGWGDIGYQYLVDLYGVAFEGHYGGDNVVGIHAREANRGTMAVSLIGNFQLGYLDGIVPPTIMLERAADLLAWKADQRDINVFNASDALPDISWGLPNLMGHRDVYGGTQTSCPGSGAYALLPQLRQDVADRIGLVDPYIYVDEVTGNFIKSDANWHIAPGDCGHNNHAYYTWSTTDPSESANWGEWRPQVPYTGRYKIEVYAPYCDTGTSETTGAHYTVTHRDGVSSVIINQDADVGLWMSLGEFNLNAGTGNVVHLTDLTTTDDGRGVWFDAIRILPIEGTAVLSTPANNAWFSNPSVQFNWSFTSPGMVTGTRLRVATDANFSNVVLDQNWGTAVTSHSHTFGQEYANLYWQVKMTTIYGNEITSTTRRFGIDYSPPTSAVDGIYQRQGFSEYIVAWSGADALSGVSHYNVQYRLDGSSTWVSWLNNVSGTSAIFTPPNTSAIYWFRSQAVDILGNTESYQTNGDMSTLDVVILTENVYLPISFR